MENIFDQLKSEINKIESEIDVNSVVIDGIHIWPIYRLGYYISQKKARNGHIKPTFFKKLLNKIFEYYFYYFNKSQDYNPLTTTVYLGSNNFRTKFDDGLFKNKFFNKISSPTNHIIEFNNKLFKLDDNSKLLECFLSKSHSLNTSSHKIIYDLSKRINKDLLTNVDLSSINNFVFKVLAYYYKIYPKLKKSNIREVYMCSYYSAPALGYVIAANKLGIKTIEVQHGAISNSHLAYCSWDNNSKEYNYLAIPKELHIWHKNFKDSISGIFKKVVVTGSYYINSVKAVDQKLEKDIFLFTLQPMDSNIPIVYQQIIQKYSKSYKMVIRTHPKHNYNSEFNATKSLMIRKYGVIYQSANDTPIHSVLNKTKIHFTGFSGSFFEAFELNIPSLIFNPIALKLISKFLDEKHCYYCGDYTFYEVKKLINQLLSK